MLTRKNIDSDPRLWLRVLVEIIFLSLFIFGFPPLATLVSAFLLLSRFLFAFRAYDFINIFVEKGLS